MKAVQRCVSQKVDVKAFNDSKTTVRNIFIGAGAVVSNGIGDSYTVASIYLIVRVPWVWAWV